MKSQGFKSILGLVALVVLTVWFNTDFTLDTSDQKTVPVSNQSNQYLLAVTWHPSFCEKRPSRRECAPKPAYQVGSNHLVLHGLWLAQSNQHYCGLSNHVISADKKGKWHQLAKLNIEPETRKRLIDLMPGYSSYLHRHEWYKHGTCMTDLSADDYFQVSLNLIQELIESPFGYWLNNNIGQKVSTKEVKEQFETSFGANSAKRLIVDCYRDEGRRVISELKISLSGDLGQKSRLKELIVDGPVLGKSCPHGILDPVGLQ